MVRFFEHTAATTVFEARAGEAWLWSGELFRAFFVRERGWPSTAETPPEQLRYRARVAVARRFGGVLPRDDCLYRYASRR